MRMCSVCNTDSNSNSCPKKDMVPESADLINLVQNYEENREETEKLLQA